MAKKQAKSNPPKKKPIDSKKTAKVDQSKLVDELKETLELEKDKYLRLFAEFENFKKRTSREPSNRSD